MLHIDQSVGRRIAYYRKKQELTQAELCSIIGLRPKYLSNVETGRFLPTIHSLSRIAAGLSVSIDELAGRRKLTFSYEIKRKP